MVHVCFASSEKVSAHLGVAKFCVCAWSLRMPGFVSLSSLPSDFTVEVHVLAGSVKCIVPCMFSPNRALAGLVEAVVQCLHEQLHSHGESQAVGLLSWALNVTHQKRGSGDRREFPDPGPGGSRRQGWVCMPQRQSWSRACELMVFNVVCLSHSWDLNIPHC